MLTEGRVRAIAAQVALAIAKKIKPSVSEEQIRSDVEAVLRAMKEAGELEGGTVTDEQIEAAVEKYLIEHPIESPEAEKAAESAKKSAEDAEASASEAKTAADEAGESARTAEQSASSADESASLAASSAESAESSASAAQTAKEGAETAKNEAAQQATNAGNAAQEAATAWGGAESAADRAEAAAGTAESIVQRVNSGDLRGEDGKSPTVTVSKVGSVATLKVKNADGSDGSVQILDGVTQITPLYAESEEWLKANGNTENAYVLDGYLWHNVETETEVENDPNNQLPKAINADGTEYIGDNGEDGYRPGYRYSASSAVDKEVSNTPTYCSIGFIEATNGQTVRVKGVTQTTSSNDGSGYCAIYFFGATFNKLGGVLYARDYTLDADGILTFIVPDKSTTSNTAVKYLRMTLFDVSDDTVITVDKEIAEGGGTTIERKWINSGEPFVYPGEDVERLQAESEQHTADIAALKRAVESGGAPVETYAAALALIKEWDAPINDSGIPVFTLDKEAKQARTDASHHTVAAIYAAYDKLATDYPQFVTREVVGETATKSHEIVKYEFKEPEPHWGLTSRAVWSETKQKAIIISGVHPEFGGIWSLYYALEELCSNPDLWDLRRNIHLIVLPVANPYGVDNASVRNDRGVEMRRNFEVDFLYPDDEGYLAPGETHHGGTSPLSEEESIIIDEIMSANTDAAFFQSCHSNQIDEIWGTGFTWASPATYYMCNMAYRNIDKLSAVWMEKYGNELAAGIADYRTENLASWDTRLGRANLSSTNGTETKQATKYGIQSINIEVTDRFLTHGTKANPEPICSAFTLSRGAEVYVNFWRIAFGLYDHKDKDKYAPVPAFKLE